MYDVNKKISMRNIEVKTIFCQPSPNFFLNSPKNPAENHSMEIISYVQDKGRAKSFERFNLPSFVVKKSKKSSKSASVTYLPFSPELRNFVAPKVKHEISFRSFFKATGHGLSLAGLFISSNVKKILLGFFLAVLFSGLAFGLLYLNAKKINYTGPLELQSGDSCDIENLNKLMANFALEGSVEVDEAGNLLDAPQNTSQVFTQPVTYQNYKVRSGDTISGIASKFGLRNISTLISVNDIGNVRQLAAGQKLKIPSIDGIIYTVKSGDSLNAIVSKYGVKLSELLDVNDLTSETLTKGQQLFIPGAALDSTTLKNAMGDLFKMPITAKFRWSSPYGKRIDPIAGVSSFHTGTDMACPTGTPILASMSGKVTTTGINRVYGNYVIIDHGNGYQTLYAHMSKIIATKGQWVSQGTRIGLVGSTGYSTGPHLHFTVYKNGKLVDPLSVLK